MRFVYRRRREVLWIDKKGRPTDTKVGILLPIPYRAAMSSLFFHYAYLYLNSLENIVAYRYVYDVQSDTVEALDTSLNPRKLDALLVSLPYELDYVYAVRCLQCMGLLGEDRSTIIVAGGIAPTANPLPLSGLVDAVALGDAEGVLEEIVYGIERDRKRSLENLASMSSVFVFEVDGGRKRRNIVADLDRAPHPVPQIVPHEEEPVYGKGLLLELSRGCSRFCSFCMEGHVSSPQRARSFDVVAKIVERGIEYGYRRVIVYSLSLFDVPYADRLLEKLVEMGLEVSIPSLRPDYLDERRIELIRKCGQRTLTIAPESLDPETALVMGKRIDVDRLSEIVYACHRAGFDHVKLYLIAGYPGEDLEKHVNALNKFLDRVVEMGVRKAKFIRFSINPLIPKPWTPHQFEAPRMVLERRRYVEELARRCESRISSCDVMDVEWGFAQSVIALGSRETSKLVIRWGLYGPSLRGFWRAFEETKHLLSYVDTGWEHPPWIDVLEPWIPLSYFERRYRYIYSRTHTEGVR